LVLLCVVDESNAFHDGICPEELLLALRIPLLDENHEVIEYIRFFFCYTGL
jgi:hypothetical protein